LRRKIAFKTALGLAIAAMLILHPAARCQSSPTYAGLVLHSSLTSPVAVPAGGTVGNLAFTDGYIPTGGNNYSAINRAIVFVAAGSSATTCTVGLSGGAVWSAPVSVPANTIVAITIEDKGGPVPAGFYETTGFVVSAGGGGAITVLPGSLATKTVIATQ
jgi:hypothetical protein